jgi:hypothetical protein
MTIDRDDPSWKAYSDELARGRLYLVGPVELHGLRRGTAEVVGGTVDFELPDGSVSSLRVVAFKPSE